MYSVTSYILSVYKEIKNVKNARFRTLLKKTSIFAFFSLIIPFILVNSKIIITFLYQCTFNKIYVQK